MTSEEFLQGKLQTAVDGADTALDIVEMIIQTLPEETKKIIVEDSGDTVEIGDALDILFNLIRYEYDLLNYVSNGILSDNGGMFTLERIDEVEQIIKDNISDSEGLYPFDPYDIETEEEEAANE